MNIDNFLFNYLNGFAGNSRLGDSLILIIGDKVAIPLVLLFLFFVWRYVSDKKGIILTAVVSTLLSRGIITELVRYFYHRPRPFSVMNVTQLIYEKNWSFPSGHMAFFFALATIVYFYNKKWGVFFFVVSLAMGIGRIAGGVHWPTDILGGITIGIASAYLARILLRKFVNVH